MKSKKHTHFVFAVGGSGGHLFLAESLASSLLKKRDIQITFLGAGANKGMHAFQKLSNVQRKTISSPPLSIKKALPFVLGFTKGLFQALYFLIKTKPELCVGFGSYHSVTALTAAKLLRIPTVLFEANLFPGKVVRLFSKGALYTASLFPGTDAYLKGAVKQVDFRSKHEVLNISGREVKKRLGLDPHVFTLLVFGGSQGALFINRLMQDFLALKKGVRPDVQIIHIMGKKADVEEMRSAYQIQGVKAYVTAFVHNMSAIYAACDACVSRSGALSVLEQITFNKPSLLIPFAKAADNHQSYNGFFMQEYVGGAAVFSQKQMSAEVLADWTHHLMKQSKSSFQAMKKAIQKYKQTAHHPQLEKLLIHHLDQVKGAN